MKKFSNLLLLAVLALGASMQGCIEDKCTQEVTWTEFQPVYMSYEAFRAAVQVQAPRDLKNTGKLYFYDRYILVNELGEGIHIIDNTTPSSPQNIAFINIPGNYDMAVKGSMLYADSKIDLVTIDISDPMQAHEVSRQQEVFPYGLDFQGLWADPSQGVVIRFDAVEHTDKYDCTTGFNGCPNCFFMGTKEFDLALSSASGPQSAPSNTSGGETQTGVGGSMARFTLSGDYLYVVSTSTLFSYSISDLANPVKANEINIGWNVETIFPFKNHLLIGSQTGMFIYNIDAPATPAYVSEFQHVRTCDPVVAEGNYAYVTLRSGNTCDGFTNELDVLDISTVTNPVLKAAFPMTNPHGLGIRDNVLFICDGDAGLKVFDATNPLIVGNAPLATFPNIQAFDVIPLSQILLMIGEDGLYQYDYSDLQNIHQISFIPVVQ